MDCFGSLSPAMVLKELEGNLRRLEGENLEYSKDCQLDHKYHVSTAIRSRVAHMVAPRTETLLGLSSLLKLVCIVQQEAQYWEVWKM